MRCERTKGTLQLFGLVAQHLRDEERQFERLLGVQAGIACGLVATGQVEIGDVLRAAEALGDVLTGQLDVDAARMGPESLWTSKKPWTSSTMRSKWRVL